MVKNFVLALGLIIATNSPSAETPFWPWSDKPADELVSRSLLMGIELRTLAEMRSKAILAAVNREGEEQNIALEHAGATLLRAAEYCKANLRRYQQGVMKIKELSTKIKESDFGPLKFEEAIVESTGLRKGAVTFLAENAAYLEKLVVEASKDECGFDPSASLMLLESHLALSALARSNLDPHVAAHIEILNDLPRQIEKVITYTVRDQTKKLISQIIVEPEKGSLLTHEEGGVELRLIYDTPPKIRFRKLKDSAIKDPFAQLVGFLGVGETLLKNGRENGAPQAVIEALVTTNRELEVKRRALMTALSSEEGISIEGLEQIYADVTVTIGAQTAKLSPTSWMRLYEIPRLQNMLVVLIGNDGPIRAAPLSVESASLQRLITEASLNDIQKNILRKIVLHEKQYIAKGTLSREQLISIFNLHIEFLDSNPR